MLINVRVRLLVKQTKPYKKTQRNLSSQNVKPELMKKQVKLLEFYT